MKQLDAWDYIKRIRNRTKQVYATNYLCYLMGTSDKPNDPDNLSYMAAQSVRMQLSEIMDK